MQSTGGYFIRDFSRGGFGSVKLEITHVTRYKYEEPIIESVNEIRLTPRTYFRQSCDRHYIHIEPKSTLLSYKDYFGNQVFAFSVYDPHTELIIKTRSIVSTDDFVQKVNCTHSFEKEKGIYESDLFQNRFAEYMMDTEYTRKTPELLAYVNELISSIEPRCTMELLNYISCTIRTHFTYKSGVSHVHSTVEDTLKLKRGVCQDFAHLMIAICKTLLIPARYVSGYHFVKDLVDETNYEQASHAWVEAYIPGVGWCGFDPTNEGEVNGRYVKLAHGRDYKDIVPVKGIYKGTDRQNLEVEVDVKLIE